MVDRRKRVLPQTPQAMRTLQILLSCILATLIYIAFTIRERDTRTVFIPLIPSEKSPVVHFP